MTDPIETERQKILADIDKLDAALTDAINQGRDRLGAVGISLHQKLRQAALEARKMGDAGADITTRLNEVVERLLKEVFGFDPKADDEADDGPVRTP